MKQVITRLILMLMALGAFTGAEAQTATYNVAGTISGLASGKTVVLKNNLSTIIVASTSSSFTFPAQSAGTSWNVSVAIQPSGQTCNVANPSGTNISANVSNVVVTCVNTYTVAGTVTGLTSGSLVLRMGTVSLVVSSTTLNFKFGTGLINGSTYAVLVGIQPSGFQCTPANNIGVINGANITNVSITCARTYTVGGTITGLTGSGLTLKLNAVSKLVAPGTTAFTFASALKSGVAYAVTVLTQPSGQTCTVTNGTGTILDSNITDVLVNCVTTSSSSSSAASSVSSSASSSTSSSSSAASSSSSVPSTFTVSGIVTGNTSSVTMTNNGGDSQTVTSGGGGFAFTAQTQGASYLVATSQPTGQLCLVFNGSGTLNANVTNVSVVCASYFTVSGTVSGHTAAITITNNGSNAITIPAGTTTFQFPSQIQGSGWNVVILASPAGQSCALTGSTVGNNIAANVTNIAVTCVAVTYSVGWAIDGLTTCGQSVNIALGSESVTASAACGASITATGTSQLSQGALTANVSLTTLESSILTGMVVTCTTNCTGFPSGAVTVSAVTTYGNPTKTRVTLSSTPASALTSAELSFSNGSPANILTGQFTNKLATGASYSLVISNVPAGQVCVALNKSGTMRSSNVTINIKCSAASAGSYLVGGTVSGLTGSLGLTLNGQTLSLPEGTSAFTFASPLPNGSYTLSISTQPPGGGCTLTTAAVTVSSADNLGTLAVSCTESFSVGGAVYGLRGSINLLNNNGTGGLVSITSAPGFTNPSFTFATKYSNGVAYSITVQANPAGQTCLVFNGSGTIAGANISNVVVSCTTNTYTLGGTVSGLGNGLSVVLLKNGSDALSITANGSFTFTSPMAAGAYVVSIGTQPLGQSCVITNGSGTVSTTNITNITVTCSTNVGGCSSAGNAGVPSSDPFWAIYSAPTSPGVDTTPLITSELPNLFQSCLQGT